MPLTTLTAGATARASDVNNNFALCLLTDTARTCTVTHTWSASQTFTGGFTSGAACTISAGGLTLTSGTLTITSGNILVTAGRVAIQSANDADTVLKVGEDSTNTSGTSQTGIVAGARFGTDCTSNGTALFAQLKTGVGAHTMTLGYGIAITNPDKGAGSTITTNYALRILDQTAGTTNYAIETGAGLVSFGDAVTCTSTLSVGGNITNTGGDFLFQSGEARKIWYVSRIIADTADFAVNNNANTARNLTITDAGSVVCGQDSALATGASTGFLYIPTCAGTPTGTPTAMTGKVAIVFDTTNNKLSVYDGGWIHTAALS